MKGEVAQDDDWPLACVAPDSPVRMDLSLIFDQESRDNR